MIAGMLLAAEDRYTLHLSNASGQVGYLRAICFAVDHLPICPGTCITLSVRATIVCDAVVTTRDAFTAIPDRDDVRFDVVRIEGGDRRAGQRMGSAEVISYGFDVFTARAEHTRRSRTGAFVAYTLRASEDANAYRTIPERL